MLDVWAVVGGGCAVYLVVSFVVGTLTWRVGVTGSWNTL